MLLAYLNAFDIFVPTSIVINDYLINANYHEAIPTIFDDRHKAK